MSLRYEVPKTLTATDMYMWWCKNKIRSRRHLKIKHANTKAHMALLVSKNSDELHWLKEHVLILSDRIKRFEKDDNHKGYFTNKTKEIYSMRAEIFESNNRIKNLKNVNDDSEQLIMSEKMFKAVLTSFNEKSLERMVDNGEVIGMKHRLGYLHVEYIKRNNGHEASKSLSMPDWGASYKYKAELIAQGLQIKDKEHPDGKKWVIFHSDEYYVKYSWMKSGGSCSVKNHTTYKFIPSSGVKGAKRKLIDSNNDNPNLYRKYKDRVVYKRNKTVSNDS